MDAGFFDEGLAVRVVPCVIFGALCLGLVGCSTFGKKSAASPNAAPRLPAEPRRQALGEAPPIPSAVPVSTPTGSIGGILAGQVIDNYSGRAPAAYIQVAEAGNRAGAPIEVPANEQGYFTIQGLQPGHQYLLTARARAGDRVLAGATLAVPPNARILIRVNADPAAQPPAPPAPAPVPALGAPGLPPPTPWPAAATSPAEQGWAPGGNPPPGSNHPATLGAPTPTMPHRAAELGPPVGISAPDPNTPSSRLPQPGPVNQPPAWVRPQDIAERDTPRDHVQAEIPGPNSAVRPGPSGPPAPDAPGWDAPPPPDEPNLGPQVRVPSCLLLGQTLQNFALNDVNGQSWQFRQHHGRLVLLDFWGTWCIHCLHAVPHLKDLQLRYGPYGLETVGIAYEDGTPQEQVQKVNRVRNRLGINYLVLMGGDRVKCPVRTQFQVRSWPTLVLLDEQGKIIWRGEGNDPQHFRELEVIIRQRLQLR